jgi:hypothetical protein
LGTTRKAREQKHVRHVQNDAKEDKEEKVRGPHRDGHAHQGIDQPGEDAHMILTALIRGKSAKSVKQSHMNAPKRDVEARLHALVSKEEVETARLLKKLSLEKDLTMKSLEASLRQDLAVASTRRVKIYEETFERKLDAKKFRRRMDRTVAQRCGLLCICECAKKCTGGT